MIIKNGDVLINGKLIKTDITIKKDKITSLEKTKEVGFDARGLTIIPGLFDIHTHGANGYDFNSASKEEMKKILDFYLKRGVTSVLPTVMTDDDPTIKRQLRLISELKNEYKIIKGIHLEGPFLSEKYHGAQPIKYLKPLDINIFKEYQKAAHGLINYITIAPELPNADNFIKYLVKNNIVISLGHSEANYDETMNALNLGATSFTHLFNAMKPINHHEPSISLAALSSKNSYVEVIMDGIHVHPEIIDFVKKIKTNKKIIGITDSLMCAGLPNGDYFIGKTPITLYNGDCKIKGTSTRAGSSLIAFDGFNNYQKFTNSTIGESSDIWSKNPAKLLNLHKIGEIKVGYFADLILLDKDKIHSVILNGTIVK